MIKNKEKFLELALEYNDFINKIYEFLGKKQDSIKRYPVLSITLPIAIGPQPNLFQSSSNSVSLQRSYFEDLITYPIDNDNNSNNIYIENRIDICVSIDYSDSVRSMPVDLVILNSDKNKYNILIENCDSLNQIIVVPKVAVNIKEKNLTNVKKISSKEYCDFDSAITKYFKFKEYSDSYTMPILINTKCYDRLKIIGDVIALENEKIEKSITLFGLVDDGIYIFEKDNKTILFNESNNYLAIMEDLSDDDLTALKIELDV